MTSELQYSFMLRESATEAMLALRVMMKKCRGGQKELHCVILNIEKEYDRMQREELRYCTRKPGVAMKSVRVVQHMYVDSDTVVRCVVGVTDGFKVGVGLHQGNLWTAMFAGTLGSFLRVG